VIKIPISYTDFDGKKLCEEHYFHLSKSELIDMVGEGDGEDLVSKLERVGSSGNGALIMRTFREIIAASYGQRVDGSSSQFYKDPDLTKRFLGSLAFDQLLEDLLTDTLNAVEFINGMMPSGLGDLAAKVSGQPVQDVPLLFNEQDVRDSGLDNPMDESGKKLLPWAFREPTPKEVSTMTHSQLLDVTKRKMTSWKPPAKV
jgi:hypothetical protein